MSNPGSVPPIRPRFPSARSELRDDSLTLKMRVFDLGPALFFLLFSSVWTVACITILVIAISQFKAILFLFGVPFWAAWFLFVGINVNNFFGYYLIVLDPAGLFYEWHVLISLGKRKVPLAELRYFHVKTFAVDSDSGATIGIEAVTLGRNVRFGTYLSTLEREWLAFQLDEHRQELQRQAKTADFDNGDLKDCRACAMPKDCAWDISEGLAELALKQRGHLNSKVVLELLFINGFWNGVVSVILAGLLGFMPVDSMPTGLAWWGMFLFLIPFESIGFALLSALLIALMEPFRVTRWIVRRDGVERVTTRLGLPLGRHRMYPCEGIDTVAIRDDLGSSKGWKDKSKEATGEQYGVIFTDSDQTEICSVTCLTLGEARWMKGRIQEFGFAR